MALYQHLVRWIKNHKLLITFLLGTVCGIILSLLFLRLGNAFFVPTWAKTVFYPGFLVGDLLFRMGGGASISIIIGILAVGVSYGIIALGVRQLLPGMRRPAEH